jgi:sec-independent protein translocase protein TatB
MLDLSLGEVALVVVVAVVFIGPKELPGMIRAASKGLRSLRSLGHEIGKAFDDLSRESGFKETTDALEHEIRLIKGDDGKLYESYQLPKPTGNDRA